MTSQKKKSVFSLPINPKIDSKFAETIFVPWLKKYKDYIVDLYFTSRMPPFDNDAMGDVFNGDIRQLFYNAKAISDECGIPLSATFNNIYVRPDVENLNLFVRNFSQLYGNGVRIATIPHTSWVSTGILQKEFPELKITLEHITTKFAVDFVNENSINLKASITPHHLILNRSDMLEHKIKPHSQS